MIYDQNLSNYLSTFRFFFHHIQKSPILTKKKKIIVNIKIFPTLVIV